MEREFIRSPQVSVVETVFTDNAIGSSMAVHHLASLGHRRIGLVLAKDSPHARKIVAGWKSACHELGLTSDEHFERLAPDRFTPGFPTVVSEVVTVAQRTGTTGLLVHSDPEAFAIIAAAQDRGMDVPGDLSVIAVDDEVAETYSPAVTAVSAPRHAIGVTAFTTLARRLEAPGRPVHRTVISPTLVVRESTGPVRPAAQRLLS
jgi:DNA-binding LacI/PurR family transcriptional regulator